jgi:hypothetical protein
MSIAWQLYPRADMNDSHPQSSDNTLIVHDRKKQAFEIAEATFNFVERDSPPRFELTFRCSTRPINGIYDHPNLEVTIVLQSEPVLLAGQTWALQPAYVDRENIWNVTNYYEWTHENFEDFTVSIREKRETSLLCEISGHIKLNRQDLPKTPVVVLAWFIQNPNTKRSVW